MYEEEEEESESLTMASLEAVLMKHFNKAEKNANERFDRIETQLDNMQATLNKHTEEIDKQRIISVKLQERIKKAETTASIHGDSLDQIQSKLADLEDRSRRDNLRLMFLKEGAEKGNALAYLNANIPKWFPRLAANPPELMRAHRVGHLRQSTSAPRVLLMKFLRYIDRDHILKEARENPIEVDGHTIRFTADYSDHTSKRRRPCFPVMHRARQQGYQAFLLYPAVIKLIRGSEQHLFCDPSEAEKFLCPEEDNPANGLG